MTLPAAALAGVVAGAGAALALRRAWRDRQRARTDLRLLGWGALLAAAVVLAAWTGPVLGVAVLLATAPLGALLVVASAAKRRRAPAGRRGATLAPEPLEGVSRAWRGWLKALLAGPLGMLAAMGVAFCYASWAPGAVETRLLVAALLVPLLWALAMTWTLADQRLLRAAAVLSATLVLGFGLAFLGGIA